MHDLGDLARGVLGDSANVENHQSGLPGEVAKLIYGLIPRTLCSLSKLIRPVVASCRERSLYLCRCERNLLPNYLLDRTLRLMASKQYRCLIGLEKGGAIYAGQIAKKLHVPFMYYSLELYIEDYERAVLGPSIEFKRLRAAERKYHRKACGTIIQDQDRASVLLSANHVPSSDATIYLVPVSLRGAVRRERSSFLREKCGLPKKQRIILHLGQIWEKRYILDLAQVAQRFPDEWTLVIHGVDWYSAAKKIKDIDIRNKVVVSLDMVPSEQLYDIVASSDIGLAFYSRETQNDMLTAFASEKMAMYMQCGVPFIAFDYAGYRRLATEDRCGLTIKQMDELPSAIEGILSHYEDYCENAQKAFQNHFSFVPNFRKVVEAIEKL